MADVAQLGRAFKQIHPEYSDVADEALGRAVKAKFPGSYEDVQDPQKAQLAKNDRIIQGMESPKDQGFLPTLWNDAKALPSRTMDFLSGHPMQDMYNAAGEQADATKAALRRNDYSSAIGHTAAGILTPLGGSQAAQAGEEIGGGQWGQGLAHGLEAVAPYGIRALPDSLPSRVNSAGREVGHATRGVGAALKAAPKAIKEAAPAGIPVGLLADQMLGPKAGLALGGAFALPDIVRAGVQGYKDSKALSQPRLVPIDRTPVWEGQGPIGSAPMPPIDPITPPGGALPSGRIPGQPVNWSGPPVPPKRIPLWEGMSPVGQRELPPVEPIIPALGALPSGRVPGTGVPKPRPEVPVTAQPTTSPVQPPGPIQTPTPIPPVGEDMSQNPVMGGAEAHRYAHAQAQAAELPGSPAGTRAGAHDALTAIAKAKYGKNAWHELAPAQMQEIGDWLLDINMQRAQKAGQKAGQGIPPIK